MTPAPTITTAPTRDAGAPSMRPRSRRRGAELAEERPAGPHEPGGARPEATLEDAVLAALRGLREVGEAACPVCGGSLGTRGSCGACGSGLS